MNFIHDKRHKKEKGKGVMRTLFSVYSTCFLRVRFSIL